MKVLVAEDDQAVAGQIVRRLQEASYVTCLAGTGTEAIALAEREAPDIVVLDRLLPGMDGLTVLRAWRDAGNRLPVLLLTALDGIADRIEGLEAGADDYMGKPFAIDELVARVNALARRARGSDTETRFEAGGISFDTLDREARWRGTAVLLQPREYRLLEHLARNAGQVVTRKMLLERVWSLRFDPQTNIVETHISRLRAKLTDAGVGTVIETVRGKGYRMVLAGQQDEDPIKAAPAPPDPDSERGHG